VGRKPQPLIRDTLLDTCVDHALAHGLPDRLEPFVSATGTSARMLLYHFATRDGLRRAVLQRARQRQLDTWGALLRRRPDESYLVTLERAWAVMAGADGEPYRRMFGQWHDTAASELLPDFARRASTDWLRPLEEGLQSIGRPELATLVLAVIRGLLMDVDATADAERTRQAFTAFTSLLAARPA
jgi:AcrR family transcriptional regulator